MLSIDYNTDLWEHDLWYPLGFGCICISNVKTG